MLLIAGLLLLGQEPTASEIDAELVRAVLERPEHATTMLRQIIRDEPGTRRADRARIMLRTIQEGARPSLGSVLVEFFFRTFLGWWILFATAFLLTLPFLGRIAAWRERRRFLKAQARRLANPEDAEARFQLAQICLEGGSRRRALEYALEAVEIAKKREIYDGVPYSHLRVLGTALYGLKRYAEAIEVFDQALKARSDIGYFDVLLGLSKAWSRKGNSERALEFARHACAEQESQLETYFRWAQAAASLGRQAEVDEARRRFRDVVRRLPRFARQRRAWWRTAMFLFPIVRRIG